MNLNLILIILLVVGALLANNFNNSKRWYIVWCSFWLILSVSLKHSEYGRAFGGTADTLSYINEYKDVIDMSIADIWQQFVERYFHGIGDYDIGYLMIQWFISRVTNSYHIFSTIADLLFFIPFAKVVNRYCDRNIEIMFAYLLYISLFHNLAMFGARQFYAMGIGMMFFLYYSDHEYKKALIALLFGVTIHMSILLVLIPFTISFLPEITIKPLHVIGLILIPLVLLAANPIIEFMGGLIGVERYANYGRGEMQGGAVTYVLLSELLSVACLVLTSLEFFEDKKFKYLYSMAPVFTFFAPLIVSNGSMIRITAYSQIFVSVLIPYLISRRFGDKAKYYLVIAILTLAVLMLKGDYQPYYFFWTVDPKQTW